MQSFVVCSGGTTHLWAGQPSNCGSRAKHFRAPIAASQTKHRMLGAHLSAHSACWELEAIRATNDNSAYLRTWTRTGLCMCRHSALDHRTQSHTFAKNSSYCHSPLAPVWRATTRSSDGTNAINCPPDPDFITASTGIEPKYFSPSGKCRRGRSHPCVNTAARTPQRNSGVVTS